MNFKNFFTVLNETFIAFWTEINGKRELIYTFFPVSSDYPFGVDFHYRLHEGTFSGTSLLSSANKELAVIQHYPLDRSVFLKHPYFTRRLFQILHAMSLEPSVASNWVQMKTREHEEAFAATTHCGELIEALVREAVDEQMVFFVDVGLEKSLDAFERDHHWVEASLINPYLDRVMKPATAEHYVGARKVLGFKDGYLALEYDRAAERVELTGFDCPGLGLRFSHSTNLEYLTEMSNALFDNAESGVEQPLPKLTDLVRIDEIDLHYDKVIQWILMPSLGKEGAKVSLVGTDAFGYVLMQLGLEEFLSLHPAIKDDTKIIYEPSPMRLASSIELCALLDALEKLIAVMGVVRFEERFTYCLDERKVSKVGNEELNALIQATILANALNCAE